jgi:hypothetical protein
MNERGALILASPSKDAASPMKRDAWSIIKRNK